MSGRLGPRGRDMLCLVFLLIVDVILCQAVVRGRFGLGPEAIIDGDALYGSVATSVRPYDDKTPIVLETPRDLRIAERVRKGHFDLWDPLEGTGVPLPPDQVGLFSPLRIVHWLFPGPAGYALFHCVRLWLAAAGTFFFARRQKISRTGSLIAGTAFGFGGGMIAQLPFVSTGPVCVLPWVLLAQAELLRRPSMLSRALVGVAVACALVTGHPTVAATVLIGAMAHGLASIAGAEGERSRRLLDLAIGWAFGIVFAAPYLIPFAEYVANGYSYKSIGRGLGEHGTWREFMRAIVGPALAGPSTLDAIREVAPGRAYPYALDFVAGTAAWILACVALVRRRVSAALLALGALGLVLCLEPPPFDLVKLPLFRAILPRYYWQLVMLPVACAAGAGADALTSTDRFGGRGPLRGLAMGTGLFAGLALAALGISTFGASQYPKPWAQLVAELPEPRPSWLAYHLIVLGALVAVVLAARVAVRAGAAGPLLVVTADIVFLMRPHLREEPASVLRHPFPDRVVSLASAVAAAHSRMTGTSVGVARAAFPSLAGLADIRLVAALAPERYDAFLRAAGAGEAGTLFALPDARSPWADLAAVRFVVADAAGRAGVASDPTMQLRETFPLSTVFENPSAFGRARLFFGATVASSLQDAEAKVRSLGRGGTHIGETLLAKTVVLEPAGKILPAALEGEGSSDVRWTRDKPDEVILETDGASTGYLMLADTFYPGWRATVDGASVPIFPADVGFRAVQVAAGEHTVRFVYRPVSMWSGVVLLAAAMVGAAIAVMRERSKAPKP